MFENGCGRSLIKVPLYEKARMQEPATQDHDQEAVQTQLIMACISLMAIATALPLDIDPAWCLFTLAFSTSGYDPDELDRSNDLSALQFNSDDLSEQLQQDLYATFGLMMKQGRMSSEWTFQYFDWIVGLKLWCLWFI